MIRTAFLAVLALVALASNVEARQRHKTIVAHPDCNVTMPCEGVAPSVRGERIAKSMGFGSAQKVYTPRAEFTPAHARSGFVAPLAAKVAEIQSSCGSRVVSGVRHTYVAGTRRLSLHASGQAVDMAGNPGCIYARLAGWGGGYSTDYGRMAHIHISYGGPEHGLRFAHGGGSRRHARHRYPRYASAR